MLRVTAIAAALVLTAGVSVVARDPGPRAGRAPHEHEHARQAVQTWVSGFVGMTEKQVRGALGPKVDRGHWTFEGKRELRLTHDLDEHSSLDIYSHEGVVVLAAINVHSSSPD